MVAPVLVWPGFDLAATPTRARRRLAGVRGGPAPGLDALALIAAALGVETPPQAPLTRLGEGLGGEEEDWICAEPVMLIPDRDRLVLARLHDDPLTAAEADQLIASSNAHFAAHELRLERPAGASWYARAPGLAGESGVAPETAERRGVQVAMAPEQAGGARMRLLNEVQMLWHMHPVNAARREAGRLQANALWLWGGGALPRAPTIPGGRTLLGSDAVVRGLAQWLQVPWAPLAPPAVAGPGAGSVIVIRAGEEAVGAQWLEVLAGSRAGFRLLAVTAEWQASRRLLPRW